MNNFKICESCLKNDFNELYQTAMIIKDNPVELWDDIASFYNKKLWWVGLFFSNEARKELKKCRELKKYNKIHNIFSDYEQRRRNWRNNEYRKWSVIKGDKNNENI